MSGPRPRTHELKTWPEFFQATLNGRKKFELRRNDRDFRVGDELLLKEWDPTIEEYDKPFGYSGREVKVRVDYIMTRDQVMTLTGLAQYVIMSVSLIP